MNNFNVIYLLTGGAPTNSAASSAAGSVGYTDLLITWLFKLTTGSNQKYYLASVVGILVFIVVAIITLVVYNVLPSVKNEEDFQ
jgi:arabinogalactan oligomer/maltooligosaccharide transport system permease protein